MANIDKQNIETKAECSLDYVAGAVAAAGKFAAAGLQKPIERPEFDDGGLLAHYKKVIDDQTAKIDELNNTSLSKLGAPDPNGSTSPSTEIHLRLVVRLNQSLLVKCLEMEMIHQVVEHYLQQLREHALQAGFQGENADKMAAIAMGESGAVLLLTLCSLVLVKQI